MMLASGAVYAAASIRLLIVLARGTSIPAFSGVAAVCTTNCSYIARSTGVPAKSIDMLLASGAIGASAQVGQLPIFAIYGCIPAGNVLAAVGAANLSSITIYAFVYIVYVAMLASGAFSATERAIGVDELKLPGLALSHDRSNPKKGNNHDVEAHNRIGIGYLHLVRIQRSERNESAMEAKVERLDTVPDTARDPNALGSVNKEERNHNSRAASTNS
jgi:hypothetical protein